MGLIAYFCLLNFRGMEASLGTLTELVLFQIYFHGKLKYMAASFLTEIIQIIFAFYRSLFAIWIAKHGLYATESIEFDETDSSARLYVAISCIFESITCQFDYIADE